MIARQPSSVLVEPPWESFPPGRKRRSCGAFEVEWLVANVLDQTVEKFLGNNWKTKDAASGSGAPLIQSDSPISALLQPTSMIDAERDKIVQI